MHDLRPAVDIDSPIGHPAEYLEYFRLFNAGEFYEAHEVLEDLWVMEVPPLRDYYKGLIMMAASLVHLERGSAAAARKLHDGARAHLAGYPAVVEGFELAAFVDAMQRLYDAIASNGGGAAFSRDKLPVLRLRLR